MAEEREDVFGSLFEDDDCSDEANFEEEAGPALVEEEYNRPSTEAGSRPVPSKLTLSLVSSRHSLWGHRLWNAALLLAEMVDRGEFVVEGKSVLELGAGAGLPSLICALNGASKVVISDYATITDQALMVPIQINVDRVQPQFVPEGTLHAVGHVWGQPVRNLIVPLLGNDPSRTGELERSHVNGRCPGDAAVDARETAVVDPEAVVDGAEEVAFRAGNRGGLQTEAMRAEDRRGGFDVIIMADLLFNRSQHAQLLETCDRCLRTGGSGDAAVWVSFSHHDPEKAKLDMKFFALADEKGFVAEKVKTVRSLGRNTCVRGGGGGGGLEFYCRGTCAFCARKNAVLLCGHFVYRPEGLRRCPFVYRWARAISRGDGQQVGCLHAVEGNQEYWYK